jgi:hypothetical protein
VTATAATAIAAAAAATAVIAVAVVASTVVVGPHRSVVPESRQERLGGHTGPGEW